MIHETIKDDEYLNESAKRWLKYWDSNFDVISSTEYSEDYFTGLDSLHEAMSVGRVNDPIRERQGFKKETFFNALTLKDELYTYKFISNRFPNCSIERSGFYYYPPGEGMRWHTNADTPYLRCYLNYSQNGDSYFKYYDQETKKTVVDMDFPGWNIRHFHINKEKENLFWHSVYSRTHRISVGFRIINNLK